MKSLKGFSIHMAAMHVSELYGDDLLECFSKTIFFQVFVGNTFLLLCNLQSRLGYFLGEMAAGFVKNSAKDVEKDEVDIYDTYA